MGVQSGIDVPGSSPIGFTGSHANDCRFGELIAQARGGSMTALGQLLQHVRRYLLLVANHSLGSDLRQKGAASDLVQETFVAAQRDFRQFQGTTEQELLAWLTKILTNRLAKQVRHFRHTSKRSVGREVPLSVIHNNGLCILDNGVAPVDAAIARDDVARLQAALERLPHHSREVLILRTWERHAFAEIAEQLGGTPESVRKSWARAVRRLQVELQR